jgi:hypothetical protein
MLRFIALISAIYDVGVGVALFVLRERMQAWFGVGAPMPPIHADLNALFVTTVGVGYLLPLRDPEGYRAYLWLFGVALKGAGAVAFIVDYVMRDSPASYLLFAAGDGLLAVATLLVLTVVPSSRRGR